MATLTQALWNAYTASPRDVLRELRRRVLGNPQRQQAIAAEALKTELTALFNRTYRTDQLVGVSEADFRQHVLSQIGQLDAAAEGYSAEELTRQRDLSIEFHWGHDHDFGSFKVDGRMQDRHLRLMAHFCTLFPIKPTDFQNKDVFDIGCWTGGTMLLLAALGARVTAIEEVRKYGNMARYLANSFGLGDRVQVQPQSLYACNQADFQDRFDIVYFPGVIYHLSDPLIALRILFNACRQDGTILVETAGIDRDEPYCVFTGSAITYDKATGKQLKRGGWNWFLPSPLALERWLVEAGFEDVRTLCFAGRVYGYGRKLRSNPICRAGLSVTDIP